MLHFSPPVGPEQDGIPAEIILHAHDFSARSPAGPAPQGLIWALTPALSIAAPLRERVR